jgi:modulator of FtsH protease HflK
MQQIYSSVTKILIDSRSGTNLLYLPLDKIIQGVSQGGAAAPAAEPMPAPSAPSSSVSSSSSDSRTRDSGRTRERETR